MNETKLGSDKKRVHPTRLKLISTVTELLETANPEDIRVEDVLGPTGITVGSLYYHFEDLSDLINQTIIDRYSKDIDISIAAITEVVRNATNVNTLLAGFQENTLRTQSPQRGAQRFHRAQTMARAVTNKSFRKALEPEQKRLTDALADLWRELQERELFDKHLDPQVGSVFLQAYSLGLIVNDISSDPVDQDAYVAFISRMLERTFLAE